MLLKTGLGTSRRAFGWVLLEKREPRIGYIHFTGGSYASRELLFHGLAAISAVALAFVFMRMVIWALVYLVNNDKISKTRIPMFLDTYLKKKFLGKYKG